MDIKSKVMIIEPHFGKKKDRAVAYIKIKEI